LISPIFSGISNIGLIPDYRGTYFVPKYWAGNGKLLSLTVKLSLKKQNPCLVADSFNEEECAPKSMEISKECPLCQMVAKN